MEQAAEQRTGPTPVVKRLRRLEVTICHEAADTIDELLAALIEIEGSGSCYCPRDVDGRRLGCKCSICVARAAIAKATP